MEENLSNMLKQTRPTESVFTPVDLDLEKETEEVQTEEIEQLESIDIVSLSSWFDANEENFPNIRKTDVSSVQGVSTDEQLVITIPTPTSERPDKRKIIVFDDSHLKPVLDLEAMDMQIYNNGFRIIYDLGNGIFIKSYSLRTSLISVFCYDVDDILIPFKMVRNKKRETKLENLPESNIDDAMTKMNQELDFESLQLLYRQSSKAEGLQTNMDAIKWLVERQASIEDTNHHLQIDNVIIDMLS